ncbi:something about silencing protein 10 [Olea europaea var. sylvestris]|uniref:something about silencing protein 10 n=1 Tax=Olea europaea var. sylvestris TaxID=158386 RepID=UPI000C1D15D5|nr:something about silencing protein 10 [Olea europaea var. sylvestris]
MGRRGGKFKRKEDNYPPKRKEIQFNSDDDDMMNDDIDAFHKQRDIVPLDINDDMEESDEDAEIPVLDFEEDKDEDDGDGDGDDDIEDDDAKPTGLAAKIARTQKYLRAKFGGVEDEVLDDAEEEEEKRAVWGRKNDMYGADVDYEPQSSDDEDAADEEKEVLKLQSKRAKALTMEDFGLEDYSQDESDREPTFEEILDKGKPKSKASLDKEINDDIDYEIVKKDFNALTKEEQMDAVYRSAPELVGLLPELNDALEQLEKKVNPLVHKIREQENAREGGMHYIEVKQLLLQCYCQAITFYLLLKAEGLPVRDHPVVSRLVEIKNLLDKIKELDENLPFDLEDIVNKIASTETVTKVVGDTAVPESDPLTKGRLSLVSSEKHATDQSKEAPALIEVNISRSSKISESRHKTQDNQVGEQSIEMLKLRAALEEKLKQKGVFSSIAPKDDRVRKHLSPMNRQLETLDDFDDEAMEIDGVACGKSNGETNLSRPSKLSKLLALQRNKPKVISGDDDIPKRDDIGERRRKHELRVLAGAGIRSVDDVEDEPGALSSDEDTDVPMERDADSDLEYYKQVERQHAAKVAAKVEKYSSVSKLSSLPEETVDGKRHITYQMEKNRGLTRARKKLTKNPRKKYKLKHQKAKERRKGQVPENRKPTGPYGGEASGINAGVSRSIRFNK